MRATWWVTALVIGIMAGLGFYTFVYARGYSYLTNDPAACANCHVMREYYNEWIKSSHRSVARCNDCHTPHNFLGKYSIKTVNGFFHSFAFTTGLYPDVIQIKGYNRRVTESACRSCHDAIVQQIAGQHAGGDLSCVRCHSSVGHYHFAAGVVSPPALWSKQWQ